VRVSKSWQWRWHARRPVVSSGGRGIRGGGQQGRGAGPGKGESDAWSPPEQEVVPGRSWSGGGRRGLSAAEGSRGAEQGARGGRREGGPRDLFAKTESPGTSL
jgi:hypothetical protein